MDSSNMVGLCRSKFLASCAIHILACLTIVLLLNITTVHCNTSSQNNSRTDSATVSLNTNVNDSATHSKNRDGYQSHTSAAITSIIITKSALSPTYPTFTTYPHYTSTICTNLSKVRAHEPNVSSTVLPPSSVLNITSRDIILSVSRSLNHSNISRPAQKQLSRSPVLAITSVNTSSYFQILHYTSSDTPKVYFASPTQTIPSKNISNIDSLISTELLTLSMVSRMVSSSMQTITTTMVTAAPKDSSELDITSTSVVPSVSRSLNHSSRLNSVTGTANIASNTPKLYSTSPIQTVKPKISEINALTSTKIFHTIISTRNLTETRESLTAQPSSAVSPSHLITLNRSSSIRVHNSSSLMFTVTSNDTSTLETISSVKLLPSSLVPSYSFVTHSISSNEIFSQLSGSPKLIATFKDSSALKRTATEIISSVSRSHSPLLNSASWSVNTSLSNTIRDTLNVSPSPSQLLVPSSSVLVEPGTQDTVFGITIVIQQQFTEDLRDVHSEGFKRLAEKLVNFLEEVYSSTDGFISAVVLSFSRGSVVADTRVIFKNNSALTKENIRNRLENANVTGQNVTGVNVTSVNVTRIEPFSSLSSNVNISARVTLSTKLITEVQATQSPTVTTSGFQTLLPSPTTSIPSQSNPKSSVSGTVCLSTATERLSRTNERRSTYISATVTTITSGNMLSSMNSSNIISYPSLTTDTRPSSYPNLTSAYTISVHSPNFTESASSRSSADTVMNSSEVGTIATTQVETLNPNSTVVSSMTVSSSSLLSTSNKSNVSYTKLLPSTTVVTSTASLGTVNTLDIPFTTLTLYNGTSSLKTSSLVSSSHYVSLSTGSSQPLFQQSSTPKLITISKDILALNTTTTQTILSVFTWAANISSDTPKVYSSSPTQTITSKNISNIDSPTSTELLTSRMNSRTVSSSMHTITTTTMVTAAPKDSLELDITSTMVVPSVSRSLDHSSRLNSVTETANISSNTPKLHSTSPIQRVTSKISEIIALTSIQLFSSSAVSRTRTSQLSPSSTNKTNTSSIKLLTLTMTPKQSYKFTSTTNTSKLNTHDLSSVMHTLISTSLIEIREPLSTALPSSAVSLSHLITLNRSSSIRVHNSNSLMFTVTSNDTSTLETISSVKSLPSSLVPSYPYVTHSTSSNEVSSQLSGSPKLIATFKDSSALIRTTTEIISSVSRNHSPLLNSASWTVNISLSNTIRDTLSVSPSPSVTSITTGNMLSPMSNVISYPSLTTDTRPSSYPNLTSVYTLSVHSPNFTESASSRSSADIVMNSFEATTQVGTFNLNSTVVSSMTVSSSYLSFTSNKSNVSYTKLLPSTTVATSTASLGKVNTPDILFTTLTLYNGTSFLKTSSLVSSSHYVTLSTGSSQPLFQQSSTPKLITTSKDSLVMIITTTQTIASVVLNSTPLIANISSSTQKIYSRSPTATVTSANFSKLNALSPSELSTFSTVSPTTTGGIFPFTTNDVNVSSIQPSITVLKSYVVTSTTTSSKVNTHELSSIMPTNTSTTVAAASKDSSVFNTTSTAVIPSISRSLSHSSHSNSVVWTANISSGTPKYSSSYSTSPIQTVASKNISEISTLTSKVLTTLTVVLRTRTSQLLLFTTNEANVSSVKLLPSTSVLKSYMVTSTASLGKVNTRNLSSIMHTITTRMVASYNVSLTALPSSAISLSQLSTLNRSSTIRVQTPIFLTLTSNETSMLPTISFSKLLPSSLVPSSPYVTHSTGSSKLITISKDSSVLDMTDTEIISSFSRSLSHSSLRNSTIRTSIYNTISGISSILLSTQSYMETVRISPHRSRISSSISSIVLMSSNNISKGNIFSSADSSIQQLSMLATSSKWVQLSSFLKLTVISKSSLRSTVAPSTGLLSSATTLQSYMKTSNSLSDTRNLYSTSSVLTFTSLKLSQFVSSTRRKPLTSTTVSHITTSLLPSRSANQIKTSQPNLSTSKVTSTQHLVSTKISDTGNSIFSTVLHISGSRSSPSSFNSKLKTVRMGTRSFKGAASSSSIVIPITSTVTSKVLPSRPSFKNFRVQVILFIPLTVDINNIFIEELRIGLQKLFDLGLTKTSLSRKRRAINEKISLLDHFNPFEIPTKNDFDTRKEVGYYGRFRRQIRNETRVKIVNITREARTEKVKVIFYVSRGDFLVPAKRAAKVMNAPSSAEKVAALGHLVSGKFSAVTSEKETTDKKKNETLLIILAICIPVVFVLGACAFIKCKQKHRSPRKMKLNKVSIEQPSPKQKISIAESANEERYTRVPTLPIKDYPDVIIQTPSGRKQRTKKPKKSKASQSNIENAPIVSPAPAAAFENITRINFDGPSNLAIDNIPLRLRPAMREDVQPQKPASKDIIEDSGVPRSWIENKDRVSIKTKDDDRKEGEEEKVTTDASHGNTPREIAELGDVESDDTIEIKANIEKWRNKMRQREKRKERGEQRKREEQDKLVKLEEKKLSRREWLMAQPEIQAILDGEELAKSTSRRRKKHRRKHWQEPKKHLDSESDNEVMVVRRPHRRRWPQRSARRVYPSRHDGLRLIAVKPKKPREYAFEESGRKQEFEPSHTAPEDSSVPDQEPVITETAQFRGEYSYSPESMFSDEFCDPYVPEYSEPRYYQPPRTEYLVTQAPLTLEQQLPLQMQETSFSSMPQTQQKVKRHVPRSMYFEQQPPRPSYLYSRPRRSPAEAKSDVVTEETGHTPSNNTAQRTVPLSKVETPSNTHTSPDKSTDGSSRSHTHSRQSQMSKSDEDLMNYSINESEARKLVSRVLERAKSEADR